MKRELIIVTELLNSIPQRTNSLLQFTIVLECHVPHNRSMNDYIHLTVASIVEHNQRFLMVEEHSKKLGINVINQPAGHVENNEPIIEAVVRETLEETAWLVKPDYITGIYQSFIDGNNQNTQYLRVCFACSPLSETDNDLDPDIIKSLWLSPEEILSLKNARSPMVKQCLMDYLNGKSFPLEILSALR